jgi:RNA polymerase sigma factor (sigma-70 family)
MPANTSSDRFERLFRCHYPAVIAYARRRAPADAVEDIVGETFLVAWRRLDRVPNDELPWLLGVARNVLATQRRGVQRREALVRRLRGSRGGLIAEAVDGSHRGVAAALAALAPKDREALLLIAWDGLTPQQAALVLGEKPGTLRVRLHRARARLRRLLDDHLEHTHQPSEHRPRVKEPAHD